MGVIACLFLAIGKKEFDSKRFWWQCITLGITEFLDLPIVQYGTGKEVPLFN
jgi:hypothetical protein